MADGWLGGKISMWIWLIVLFTSFVMGLKNTTLFLGGGFIWAMKEKGPWLFKV